MTTLQNSRSSRRILDLFKAPFKLRSNDLLDYRALSNDLKRDIGLIEGHRIRGSIRCPIE